MTDYTQFITWEHVDKPKYMQLVALVTGAVDQIRETIADMPALFDVDNAVGPQLDVVGLWVGQPRLVDQVLVQGYFGFADNAAAKPFGELTDPSAGGRFYEQGDVFANTTTLADSEYRTVIKARIARNQWDGTLPGLEAALTYVFGAGCYVTDPGTLSLTITIGRVITPTEQALLSTFDLLPHAAGVAIGTIQYRNPLSGAITVVTSASGTLT